MLGINVSIQEALLGRRLQRFGQLLNSGRVVPLLICWRISPRGSAESLLTCSLRLPKRPHYFSSWHEGNAGQGKEPLAAQEPGVTDACLRWTSPQASTEWMRAARAPTGPFPGSSMDPELRQSLAVPSALTGSSEIAAGPVLPPPWPRSLRTEVARAATATAAASSAAFSP